MSRIINTLIAICAFGIVTTLGPAQPSPVSIDYDNEHVLELDSTPRGPAQQDPEEHVVVGGALRDRYRVYLGIALYERAGLDIPAMRIYIHDDESGCSGYGGLFNNDGSGSRIDLCGDLIRHELAHAYTYHNLSDATRQAFVEYANLPTWGDHSYQHGSRGIEQAANVISWNVALEPLDAAGADTYAEFLHRYTLLTGNVSPRVAHLLESTESPDSRTHDVTIAD